MRWTGVIGAGAGAALLAGCGFVITDGGLAVPYYEASSRPVGSYYCYDCHGYRYFDPYYDWCSGYGFRYAWNQHPEAVTVYRERYVQIKERHPGYGRYRYPARYRESRRYREELDYESWKSGASKAGRPSDLRAPEVREKESRRPGKTKKPKDGRERSPRREHRRPAGPEPARPAPPEGA